jgi:nondiscriminating aspartyl-tRNA synthetase
MERIRTTEAAGAVGRRVRLQGWLHQFRELGKINFLIIRDGWGTFQAVVDAPAALDALRAVQVESLIELRGVVVAEAQAPGGAELHETEVSILEPVLEPPPIELNKREMKAALETFLDHAVIGLRHPRRRAILRLGSAAMAGFRTTLDGMGFVEIQTPKILGSATEGGANVFTMDYFGQPAYLAQSPQLYKQIAVGFFERVYEVGPVFRAEPHATTRHLAEYVSLDVELGFIEDHTTVMAVLGQVIAGMLAELRRACATELALLGAELPEMPADAPSIYFPEAQELLEQRYGVACRGEPDLAPEHERLLGRWAQETYGSDFLFVTGYPTAKRAFYTHPNPSEPYFSNSFDLLFRGLELVSGGQRLHRYADYEAVMRERGMAPEPFAEYLKAFRFGMPPHGGFAIGLERFLMQLLGLPNLRLATLFPRDMNRLTP